MTDISFHHLRRLLEASPPRQVSRVVATSPSCQEPMDIHRVVEGTLVETPHGVVFTTRVELPVPVRAAFDLPIPPLMAGLARRAELAGVRLGEFVFLDTETTGLSTTAGSFPFLIGLAHVSGTGLVVEQIFARDFHEEPALLHLLAQRVAHFPGMITYNGAAFDIPLLETRFALQRIFQSPLPPLHLDMLHPARRLWRARATNCALATLQQEVLGLSRELDVPSALIPSLYLMALRTKDARHLLPVFHHNRHDLVSLACLASRAAEALGMGVDSVELGEDLMSLARILEEADPAQACALYRRACARGFRSATQGELAMARWATLLRRMGRVPEAMDLFGRLARRGTVLRPYALVELSKHHEHRTRDVRTALDLALAAMEAVREPRAAGALPSEFRVTLPELTHRIRRLKFKLARCGSGEHPMDPRGGTDPAFTG